MRRLAAWVGLALALALCGAATQAQAGTYTATGRVVDASGHPRSGWTVAVSYHYSALEWWTVHTTTTGAGTFTVARDFDSVSEILVTPAQGFGYTLSTPNPGTYNFGDVIGGNCRNCPLPADGSGNP